MMATKCHLDHAADHLLSGIKVGNYTVTQRAYGLNTLRGTALHHLCLVTDSHHLAVSALKGND